MAEEHIFDRITKAQTAEQNAWNEVDKLTKDFQNIANLFNNWRLVTFVWCDAEGTRHGPMPSQRDTHTIIIKDAPDLVAIRAATVEWHKSHDLTNNLISTLTEEQRQTLRLPPR